LTPQSEWGEANIDEVRPRSSAQGTDREARMSCVGDRRTLRFEGKWVGPLESARGNGSGARNLANLANCERRDVDLIPAVVGLLAARRLRGSGVDKVFPGEMGIAS
jgi:hypothetical protein